MFAIGVVIAIAFAFLALSLLSPAARIRKQLRPFVGRTVLVTNSRLVIESVTAIGAGLHIRFRCHDGSLVKLKVAQPTAVSISPERIEIAGARYVQWGSRRSPAGTNDSPAVVLTLTT